MRTHSIQQQAISETFADRTNWADVTQERGNDTTNLYTLVNKGIRFELGARSFVRPKLRLTNRVKGPGRHQWRVYTPMFAKGDTSSIGAFLCMLDAARLHGCACTRTQRHGADTQSTDYDDQKELDFEIGYGSDDARRAAGAKDNEMVAYLTTQAANGVSWGSLSGGYMAVAGNAWHDLTLDLDMDVTGTQYIARWWVDGKFGHESSQGWGPEDTAEGLYPHISLEGLWWMTGAASPSAAAANAGAVTRTNTAFFDGYAFTPTHDCPRERRAAPAPLAGDAPTPPV